MRRRGEITVFLSLLLSVVLFFFQALFQSAGYALFRSQLEEALELCEYSVLSEYHRTLWERYELFYLDLGYGGGAEKTAYLNQQAEKYLNLNLKPGKVKALETWDYARATDQRGMAYYEQAVSVMKAKTGASLLDKLVEYAEYGQQAADGGAAYQEADSRESQKLEDLRRRREEEEEKGTPNPADQVEQLKHGSILNLVLQDPGAVSGKRADLAESPSKRTLPEGAGPRGRNEPGVVNDAWFLAYLLEHFSYASAYLTGESESGPWLDYQLEYLIAGEETDIANLEAVCGRLLAIREGMNYAYLLSDSGKVAECTALAAALVGVTLIPGLVEAVKQVLLLAWAFAESVLDVRLLLNGKRVAFQKDAATWKLSLSGALELEDLSGLDEAEDADGLLYRDYLGILLTLTGREKRILRSLDAIEGVVRETDGQWFYVDQCIDAFLIRTVVNGGQEYTAERMFCYEW